MPPVIWIRRGSKLFVFIGNFFSLCAYESWMEGRDSVELESKRQMFVLGRDKIGTRQTLALPGLIDPIHCRSWGSLTGIQRPGQSYGSLLTFQTNPQRSPIDKELLSQ